MPDQYKKAVEVLKNYPSEKIIFRRIALRIETGGMGCRSCHGTDCGKPSLWS